MGKNSIKWACIFVFLAFGFTQMSTAQIYSDETCIYKVQNNGTYNIVIKYDGSKAYVATKWPINSGHNVMAGYYDSDLREGFKKNNNYTEDLEKQITMYYDSELSTPSRAVYYWFRSNGGNTYYIAVSNDLSSIKCWTKNKSGNMIAGTGGSGKTGEVAEGVRINPSVFKPKAVNYDFLND